MVWVVIAKASFSETSLMMTKIMDASWRGLSTLRRQSHTEEVDAGVAAVAKLFKGCFLKSNIGGATNHLNIRILPIPVSGMPPECRIAYVQGSFKPLKQDFTCLVFALEVP